MICGLHTASYTAALYTTIGPTVPTAPEGIRAVVTGPTTVLVSWAPPRPALGAILHYNLYSARNDQVR